MPGPKARTGPAPATRLPVRGGHREWRTQQRHRPGRRIGQAALPGLPDPGRARQPLPEDQRPPGIPRQPRLSALGWLLQRPICGPHQAECWAFRFPAHSLAASTRLLHPGRPGLRSGRIDQAGRRRIPLAPQRGQHRLVKWRSSPTEDSDGVLQVGLLPGQFESRSQGYPETQQNAVGVAGRGSGQSLTEGLDGVIEVGGASPVPSNLVCSDNARLVR